MAQINYVALQEKLSSLKEKTHELLIKTENKELASRLDAELSSESDRKKLKIAFVGQYNAGKSTIISALTGNKHIKIHTNIATDEVAEYKWHDIILMDTPGILAGKREEHDEQTKKALKECDLIFYVITSNLFNEVLFKNFLDLAYNQHLADKMFVIINKMGMESGEYDDLVTNYTLSLDRVFQERGYRFEEFPTAFIDSNDYIDGVQENDEEFIELSHFVRFIDMLNAFVEKKGLIKKQFDTPVRILQSYLKNTKVSAIDPTLCDLYNQYEQKLTYSQREIKRDIKQVLSSFDSSAMNKVITLASKIGTITQDEWNQEQNELDKELSSMISQTSETIEDQINQSYDRLLQVIKDFGDRESVIKYTDLIEGKINSPSISIEEKKNLEFLKIGVDLLRKGGEYVAEMAPGVQAITDGPKAASGSELHKRVLDIGHYFGKDFKPWEAAKYATNIAKVAKFGVPVFASGLDIYMQVRDDRKENQRLKEIQAAKSKFVTVYQTEINKIKSQFEDYLQKVLENYTNKRNEINRSKDELIAAVNRNKKLSQEIDQLEDEYVDFIEIVNGKEYYRKA